MNYQRIYDELIADRRANPPSDDEYVEVHHILPRCMGGGDESENLIRLRPEDHFFAHLLLARIYGGSLWMAVRIMAAAALGLKPEVSTYRFGKTMPGVRAIYAMAREWADANLTGVNHPNADKTVYRWRHINGDEEMLAPIEMANKYGFRTTDMSALVRGSYKSVRGWYLPDRTSPEDLERPSGLDHPMADRTIYSFRNVDGREYRGTRYELAANDNVPPASINNMITGRGMSAYGWYLPEQVPDGIVGRDAQSGDRNGFADRNVYAFKHIDGTEETCTRHVLIAKYGLKRGALNMMMAGKALSSQGWYRLDLNPDGVAGPPTAERNNKFNPEVHHFIHDDGREERLTLYAMHAKHGGNRASWNRCMVGGTYVGWRLHGSNPKRSSKGAKHTFCHVSGVSFFGTQAELATKHGLSATSACRIVKEGYTSHGWSLAPANDNRQSSLKLSA